MSKEGGHNWATKGLLAGGLALAASGAYALHVFDGLDLGARPSISRTAPEEPEREEVGEAQAALLDGTQIEVADVMDQDTSGNTDDAGIDAAGDTGDDTGFGPDTPNDVLKQLALDGSLEAAKLLVKRFDARWNDIPNPRGLDSEDEAEKANALIELEKNKRALLAEIGISEDEYKAFYNAHFFDAQRAFMENRDGAFDRLIKSHDDGETILIVHGDEDQAEAENSLRLSRVLDFLCALATSPDGKYNQEGPYNPLFLKLIGMSAQELQDFAKGIYGAYADRPRSEHTNQLLAFLQYAYGFEVESENAAQ